jgi:hypothetical protein
MGKVRSGKRVVTGGNKSRYSGHALPAGMEERIIITIINYHHHDHQQK